MLHLAELTHEYALPYGDQTLLFNDSVQDAAHRAGFVASRSYSFSLRTLLAAVLDNHDGGQASLNDLIADVIANASNPQWLPAVVPPDLQGRSDVDALLAGDTQGDADTWRLISERLAFQVVLEFGLRSRQGRTLELTRTAAAEVIIDAPARIAALAKDLMVAGPDTGLTRLPQLADFTVLIRGILERLRVSGGIRHHWLNAWIGRAGTRRWGTIWGNRPDGMPAFPLSGRTRRGVSAPAFVLGQRKERTEFDVISTRQGWYAALFGDSGWLRRLIAAAIGEADEADRLVGGFLAPFPRHVDDAARDELLQFARTGLKVAAAEAEDSWRRRLADLRDRLGAIDQAMSELIESDPVQLGVKREFAAERRGIAKRVGEIGRTDAHGALVDLGLLPNYSLIDVAATLEATLTWHEEDDDGGRRYHSELRECTRPARHALTELAPGNHYYIRGYRHHVSGLGIGTRTRPAWEHWRVCQQCGFVREGIDAQDTSPCPRCRNPRIGDASALHRVLRPVRVTSHDRRDDARIADDDDDRQRTYYEQAIAVDIQPGHIEAGSWRHANATFGVDYTRHAVVRRFNLGVDRADRPASGYFAGQETRISPFYACVSCGGTAIDRPQADSQDPLVSSGFDTSPSHHRPWCPERRSAGAASTWTSSSRTCWTPRRCASWCPSRPRWSRSGWRRSPPR